MHNVTSYFSLSISNLTARHKLFGKAVLKTFAPNHISPGMSAGSSRKL
jgi:hypothetical protein